MAPGSILLILNLTGAPAAFALALGFQDPTKGTATPTAPTAPTIVVAPINKLRRDLFTTSLLMTISPITASTASNQYQIMNKGNDLE
jgi:hypothetical protein